ncbi:acyl-CoA thioesterase [Halobacterium yunchengense]|uniref:acyl-CoA thioesterase n=1 Tax=Halobacterium yunchengense TaxID=3108497 RepID=UPI003008E445
MTEFPFVHTVAVRYQDYDMLGHVNNAVYAAYLEDARTEFLDDYVGLRPGDIDMVLAHLEFDYRAPVEDAREVDVALAVTDVGTTSFGFAYEVRDGDAVAVEAESVQVVVDPETAESQPIPADWRAALEGARR